MTYMYNGTVSVPHNKLQLFLKTAEALKIKGIVDTGSSDDSAVSDTSVSPLVSPGNQAPSSLLPAQVQELLSIPLLHQHPAGDLSLLASAASEQPSAEVDSKHNSKRRKTAPRKLGSYLLNNTSHINHAQNSSSNGVGSDEDTGGHSDKDTEKENNWMALQMIKKDREVNGSLKEGLLLTNTNGKVSAMNLSKPIVSSSFKTEKDESLDLTVKSLMTPGGDEPKSPSPPTSTSQLQLLSSSILPTSTASPLNLLVRTNLFCYFTISPRKNIRPTIKGTFFLGHPVHV